MCELSTPPSLSRSDTSVAMTQRKPPPFPLSSVREGSEAVSQRGREGGREWRRRGGLCLFSMMNHSIGGLITAGSANVPSERDQNSNLGLKTARQLGMTLELCHHCGRNCLHVFISQ